MDDLISVPSETDSVLCTTGLGSITFLLHTNTFLSLFISLFYYNSFISAPFQFQKWLTAPECMPIFLSILVLAILFWFHLCVSAFYPSFCCFFFQQRFQLLFYFYPMSSMTCLLAIYQNAAFLIYLSICCCLCLV